MILGEIMLAQRRRSSLVRQFEHVDMPGQEKKFSLSEARPRKDRIFLFDVDGTLTIPRKEIDEEMKVFNILCLFFFSERACADTVPYCRPLWRT